MSQPSQSIYIDVGYLDQTVPEAIDAIVNGSARDAHRSAKQLAHSYKSHTPGPFADQFWWAMGHQPQQNPFDDCLGAALQGVEQLLANVIADLKAIKHACAQTVQVYSRHEAEITDAFDNMTTD